MGFQTLSLLLRGRKLLLHFVRGGRQGDTQVRKRQSIINLYMTPEVETEAVGPGTPRRGSKHMCKLPEITVTNLCRPAIFQAPI